MFAGLSEQLHEFGQMCVGECVELWQVALGCVCGLQAGLALLNDSFSPVASSWQCLHLGNW